MLDDWELVVIARNGVSRVMTTGFDTGARVPAPLISPGVVLLAYNDDQHAVSAWLDSVELLPYTPHTMTTKARLREKIEQARADGYALIEQQLQVGVRGIAVPLRNRHGESHRGAQHQHADRQRKRPGRARARAAAPARNRARHVERGLKPCGEQRSREYELRSLLRSPRGASLRGTGHA